MASRWAVELAATETRLARVPRELAIDWTSADARPELTASWLPWQCEVFTVIILVSPEGLGVIATRSGDGATEGPDEEMSMIEEGAAILEINSID
jgi:hypothetical protein